MPGLPVDILASGEILVYLAPDQTAFDSLAPGVPDWSGGIAFPQGDRIVLPTFTARLSRTPLLTVLRHELAHVALGRYLGSRVPRWFHEGYAQLAAGSWSAKDAWTLRVAILLGRLPSLESLSLDFRGGRLSADHAYLLSYTVVEYMRRLGGPTGFTRLLQRWRETGDLDSAMRRTYGLTLGRFEQMWRKDVGSRFGWPLVLAQTAVYWTLLTIFLLVMGYWKKRRDRQKLVALEAAAGEFPLGADVPDESGEQGHKNDMIDGK
jgi:Peptidase MA superfamily